jgi:hypothetical protein
MIITSPLGERTLWAEKRRKNLADPDAQGQLVDWVEEGYTVAGAALDGSGANGATIYVTFEYEGDAGQWVIATFFIAGVATLMDAVPLRLHPDPDEFPTVAVLSVNFPDVPGVVYRATITFDQPNYEDREPYVLYYQVQ